MKASRDADDVIFDNEVGARIRDFRKQAGMTQTELATAAGVTFQQIQKYERGTNRVAASRLALIAKALGVEAALLLGGGAASDLAPGEQQLVNHYRQLTSEQQALARSMLESMIKA
ncbi:helix-turn-helix domain-containing protein [Brevundimonas sp. NPDC092305]|uniref:helix-turn-helix domain-containing protein n=1 Tax=Brevundimonas sp. NPDC092305 TaxID=3363957 RepID=UPI00380865EE